MRDLKVFQDVHPGFLLSIKAMADHTHVCSYDLSKFMAQKMQSTESFAIFMRGFFYMLQVCQPNIAAMRVGTVHLAESKDIGWRNINYRVEEQAVQLYSRAYPMRLQKMVYMNVSFTMRVFLNAMKILMCKTMRERHTLQPDSGAYLQDSPYPKRVLPKQFNGLIDYDELQRDLSQKLKERYSLATTFKL